MFVNSEGIAVEVNSTELVAGTVALAVGEVVVDVAVVVDDVKEADEAFMTATPFCMLPVTSIHGEKIGDGKRGPIFEKLLKEWSTNVGINIESQIKDFNKELEGKKISGPSPYQFKNKIGEK